MTDPHTTPFISHTSSGSAQSGMLTVTGATHFGRVHCGGRAQRTLSLCNTGASDLFVSQVLLRRGHGRFRLMHNPFPAVLQPGACLKVVIEFHAVDLAVRPCELLIHSTDCRQPTLQLDLLAHAVYDVSQLRC